MLSCKKATELTEKQTVSSLGFIDRKRLSLHAKMCKICSKYQSQSMFIDNALEQLQDINKRELIQLSPDKKEKIINSLKQKGV